METTFPSLILWENSAVNGDTSFQTGGRVSRHPRSGKAEVVAHGDLNVNKHATCDFNISPVTV